jgi:hypothetical protein
MGASRDMTKYSLNSVLEQGAVKFNVRGRTSVFPEFRERENVVEGPILLERAGPGHPLQGGLRQVNKDSQFVEA